MKEHAVVEAALFSSGKAVTVDDLSRTTGLDPSKVKGHLRTLAKEYERRGSAIEVAQIGTKWTMQIRSDYTDRARTFAPPEIDRDLIKTAALVAYHQPLLQSDLFDMIGSKVYDHTQALEKLGLITRAPSGRSLSLTTTRYFSEFFGLKETNREGIRRRLAEKSGIAYKEKGSESEPLTPESASAAPGSPTDPVVTNAPPDALSSTAA